MRLDPRPENPAADLELIAAIRAGLAERGDPFRAASQQRYMKSAMPYAGMLVPDVRRMVLTLAAAHPQQTFEAWRDTVLALWHDARVREERYAATNLCAVRSYRAWALRLDMLAVYRTLIVTGAWWDHVDDVAIHRVGPLLRAHRDEVRPVVLAWSGQRDRWLRRSAVICQIGSGADTDRDLLRACITVNVDDPDFFLRKAIGWALRQYARVAPEWVATFVDEYRDRLSPLSQREALKHLGPAAARS